MKDLWKSGVLILLIIGVLYILYLRECKHPLPCPAEDEVIVKKQTWDSIISIANMSPIVIHDTIKGDTVFLSDNTPPDPKPEPKDSTINNFRDSLYNKEINVWYDFKVRDNKVFWKKWAYIPITITTDSIIYVPKLVDNPIEIPISKAGLYMYGNVGGNTSNFIFGGGIDYINKKDNLYGYMYQRYGNLNFHSIRIGGKIRFH